MNWPKVWRNLFYGLAFAIPVAVVGSQQAHIGSLLASNRGFVVVAITLFCLLAALFRFFATQGIKWWDGDIWVTSGASIAAVSVGLYLISAIGGYVEPQWQNHVMRAAMGWALAYCAAGFLVGFLFGIPRVLQADGAPAAGGGNNTGQATQPYEQRVNTNLEQISDWLTKIIVGLGLVELRSVPDHLYKASIWMGQALGLKNGETSIASFSSAFIVYFLVVGFLAGYLMTRLFLAGAFWRADRRQTRNDSSYSSGPIADQIRKFWKPQGQVNPGNLARMNAWLKQEGIPVILPQFISSANFAAQRAKMVADLEIPP